MRPSHDEMVAEAVAQLWGAIQEGRALRLKNAPRPRGVTPWDRARQMGWRFEDVTRKVVPDEYADFHPAKKKRTSRK